MGIDFDLADSKVHQKIVTIKFLNRLYIAHLIDDPGSIRMIDRVISSIQNELSCSKTKAINIIFTTGIALQYANKNIDDIIRDYSNDEDEYEENLKLIKIMIETEKEKQVKNRLDVKIKLLLDAYRTLSETKFLAYCKELNINPNDVIEKNEDAPLLDETKTERIELALRDLLSNGEMVKTSAIKKHLMNNGTIANNKEWGLTRAIAMRNNFISGKRGYWQIPSVLDAL